MHMMFLLLTLIGCVLLYLSHPRQGWLANAIAPKPWRYLGFGLLTLALVCGLNHFSTITAICGWLAISLLCFSLLPFGILIINSLGKPSHDTH